MSTIDPTPRRRRRNRGSLRRLDESGNKWELCVALAKRPDGRPDWLSRTFYGREAAAQRALEDLLAEFEGKRRADIARTFGAVFGHIAPT
jgi:hypothetical protein